MVTCSMGLVVKVGYSVSGGELSASGEEVVFGRAVNLVDEEPCTLPQLTAGGHAVMVIVLVVVVVLVVLQVPRGEVGKT